MSTLSLAELLYIILCSLAFLVGCFGAYVAQSRLTTALRALAIHPEDKELMGKAHVASDAVRSSLAKATLMLCFLSIGVASALLPAPPPSTAPVPVFVWIVPISLIVGPAVLALDFCLEWRSRLALEELVRAIKRGASNSQ